MFVAPRPVPAMPSSLPRPLPLCPLPQDRLVNNEDRDWFLRLIQTLLKKHCGQEWSEVITSDRLIFADFMIPGADPKIYTQVSEMHALQKIVEESLEDYNSVSNAPMKLVMFLDAIEHVSRICRVIRLPLGNALLLGVGGSGRQSLTRLATSLEEYEVRCAALRPPVPPLPPPLLGRPQPLLMVPRRRRHPATDPSPPPPPPQLFQIEIAKGYGNNEWRDDLKRVLFMAGVDGKDTTFLFTDTQIVKESFLEDINNILNSGEVPNLFGNDDLEKIGNVIRPIMQASGQAVTKMGIYNTFVARVRSRLHICLCFSPIGDAFRHRLRMFPALVNCCTIDWFSEWPMEALKSVATNKFSDLPLSTDSRPHLMQGVVDACVFIHQSVERKSKTFYDELRRYNYVTPTSYLELLSTFIKLLGVKRDELGQMRKRLEIGLDKLLTTSQEVRRDALVAPITASH